MRPILFFIAVLTGLGCSPKLTPPSPPMPGDGRVDISHCNFYNDYSAKERLSREPFGQSEKVELVSFDGMEKVLYFEDSTVSLLPRGEIPKKDSKVDRSQFIEIITLTTSQLDSLTNIFFNYDYGRAKNGMGTIDKLGCFVPRHALLFFRKKTDAEPFAYFEICLECKHLETFPKEYELGNFCKGKFDLLREFFRQTGIKYGLEK